MAAIKSLLRGFNYVQTGLYDKTAKNLDGVTNKFNPASDFVVKYRLIGIDPADSDPENPSATYKEPVRLLNGDPTKYCIVHNYGSPYDGVYLLDQYDPFSKAYRTMGLRSEMFSFGMSKINRNTIRYVGLEAAVITPVNYSNQPGDVVKHFYTLDGGATQCQFNLYYYDPINGIPVKYNGVPWILKGDSLSSPGMMQYETHQYHKLFFAGEKYTFFHVPNDYRNANNFRTALFNTYANDFPGNLSTRLESNTTFQVYSPDSRVPYNIFCPLFTQGGITYAYARNPIDQWGGEYNAAGFCDAIDGIYNIVYNGITYRVDHIQYNSIHYFCPKQLPTYTLRARDDQPFNISAITIPSVTASSPTISLVSNNTPANLSTTTTLVKGVDYVPTGIHDASAFTYSLVVKCKIGSTVGKYQVYVNSDGTYSTCINSVVYTLAGYSPNDRYYVLAPSDMIYSLRDRDYLPQKLRFIRQYGPFKTKVGDRTLRTYNTHPNYQSRIKPAGYGQGAIASTYSPITAKEGGPFNIKFSLNQFFCNDATAFTHFNFADSGAVTVQHAGEVFLLDPSTVGTGAGAKFNSLSVQYHQLFFQDEKVNVYNCTPDGGHNTYASGRTQIRDIANTLYVSSDVTQLVKTTATTLTDYAAYDDDNMPSSFSRSAPDVIYLMESSIDCELYGISRFIIPKSFMPRGNDLFTLADLGFAVDMPINTLRFIKLGAVIKTPCGLWIEKTPAAGAIPRRWDIVELVNVSGYYKPCQGLTDAEASSYIGVTVISITYYLSGVIQASLSASQISALTTQVNSLQSQLTAAQNATATTFAAVQTNLTASDSAIPNTAATYFNTANIVTQLSSLNAAYSATTDTSQKNAIQSQINMLNKVKAIQDQGAAVQAQLTTVNNNATSTVNGISTSIAESAASIPATADTCFETTAIDQQITKLISSQAAIVGFSAFDMAQQGVLANQIDMLNRVKVIQTLASSAITSYQNALSSVFNQVNTDMTNSFNLVESIATGVAAEATMTPYMSSLNSRTIIYVNYTEQLKFVASLNGILGFVQIMRRFLDMAAAELQTAQMQLNLLNDRINAVISMPTKLDQSSLGSTIDELQSQLDKF